eukprot:14648544-Alexandrium_andersonii.AAC.1
MSASLVGSEMCIRDRLRLACTHDTDTKLKAICGGGSPVHFDFTKLKAICGVRVSISGSSVWPSQAMIALCSPQCNNL